MRRTRALPRGASREQRFWAKVEWSEGCWAWLGARDRWGYGRFWHGPNYIAAHREAYSMAVGAIPNGMHIDHLCRNPNCVNPAHLEVVTSRLNTLRTIGGAGDRAARTTCPAGHPYDAENTYLSAKNQRHCYTCMKQRQAGPRAREVASCRYYTLAGRPCTCGAHLDRKYRPRRIAA